jgi:glycosyltransferase involved in cell wall biosynthesis
MRILLLSAYDAHSHRRWRQGLVEAFPDWQWTVLTLPPRNFLWRMRGNSLSWAFSERETLEQPYDLLLATSMTDLSALKGMVPSLAHVPCMVYCHENQFTYPDRREQQSAEPIFVSLYSVLAADRVVFNSGYNRQTFLEGAKAFLKMMPDAVPPGVVEHIAGKSCVIPVPLEQSWFADTTRPAAGPFTIVWNHRWEYDKAPERMFAALLKLHEDGVDFRVHVIGQQFRERPPVFAEMRPLLDAHTGEWGMVESATAYRQLLQESRVVLSTTLHEFQGLAVLEAVASGCVPLVPDRLAYPEFIAEEFRYPSYPDGAVRESEAIAAHLKTLAQAHQNGTLPRPPDVSQLSWPQLRPVYEKEIRALL